MFLDFAKALDKVDFGLTLKKLADLGVKGNIGRWIYCFLTNLFRKFETVDFRLENFIFLSEVVSSDQTLLQISVSSTTY